MTITSKAGGGFGTPTPIPATPTPTLSVPPTPTLSQTSTPIAWSTTPAPSSTTDFLGTDGKGDSAINFDTNSSSDVSNKQFFSSYGSQSQQSVYSNQVSNQMLSRPLSPIDERALNSPMDNVWATRLDTMVTTPGRRSTEQITEQVDIAYRNTFAYPTDSGMTALTALPGSAEEILATGSFNEQDVDFDNLGNEHQLRIGTSYSINANDLRTLSMAYSVRNATEGPLPYASDGHLAHLQVASEAIEGFEQGDAPRMPEILTNETVSGSNAVKLIGDIYNRNTHLQNDYNIMYLGVNHGEFDADSLQQAQDVHTIATKSVNGKSLINMMNDYNQLYDTNFSLSGLMINMNGPESESVPGYFKPDLIAYVADETNQEP